MLTSHYFIIIVTARNFLLIETLFLTIIDCKMIKNTIINNKNTKK